MSTLTQFIGGGIRQIKTGFIRDAAPSGNNTGNAANEDYYYYDVTLSGDAVSDVTKCVIMFDGLGHYTSLGPNANTNVSTSITYNTRVVTTRLQNTTTLRLCQQYDANIGANSAYYYTTGRWTLIEYR
jgi:hypothetical protein